MKTPLNALKFKKLSLFLSLLLTAATCRAFTPTGYPGAVWTQSGRDTKGIDGTNTQGFVRQGVELLRLDGGQSLQVYGRYNWRLRNVHRDYYNEYTPYAGAMFSFKYADVGAEFGWPHYTGLSNSNKDHSIFVNWFRYWGLKEWSKKDLVKALPLSTWGTAAYDIGGQNGSSTQGWAKLEADLLWLPHDWMVGPFVSYDWRLRSQNARYFNLSEVSSGIEIGNEVVQAGAKYAWSNYPRLKQKDRGVEFFITVYKAWDLKRGDTSKTK